VKRCNLSAIQRKSVEIWETFSGQEMVGFFFGDEGEGAGGIDGKRGSRWN
jgi:hypothetical protein